MLKSRTHLEVLCLMQA